MEGGSIVVEVHIVQKGDTLWKISRQHGISFEELKRVNAHLANPDYIVPGMKIFLPDNKGKGAAQPSTGASQEKGNTVEKIVKVEKKEEPIKKPVPPKAETEKPKEPIPLPTGSKPPTITTKPTPPAQPVPPVQPKPTVPKDEKPKAPSKPTVPERPAPEHKYPAPNTQQQYPQMVPMQPYPIIGIPCGWFPIYDADCYSHLHQGQFQPMPPHAGQLPGREQPTMPCNPATRPMQQERPLPQQEPVKPSAPKPQLQKPILSVPTGMPNIEAPEIPALPPKVEQVPPRVTKPSQPQTLEEPPIFNRPQTLEEPPRQHFPYEVPQQFPTYSGHATPCGCNQLNVMPMYPQQMPMQVHPFCNTCHQPMPQQPMFYPMPYPWQHS